MIESQYLDKIARTVATAPRARLMLDFDGTLAPIAERPALAEIPPKTRATIEALSRLPHTTVAIISGRGLNDLAAKIAIPGLILAANHGLEIQGPDFHFVDQTALDSARDLLHLSNDIDKRTRSIAGVEIENKGLTASIHYRRVRADDRERIAAIVAEAIAPFSDRFLLTSGKMIHEIRPRVDRHKGRAVRQILSQIGEPSDSILYIGDDDTDEDAFRELSSDPNAITIRVGEPNEQARTAASFEVDDPATIADLLKHILMLRKADERFGKT
jgi:trehalose 6-phosphate phosphatase